MRKRRYLQPLELAPLWLGVTMVLTMIALYMGIAIYITAAARECSVL